MKIAIVHDSLVEFGGAERVLLALLELFPNADVYTAYTDKAFIKTFSPRLDLSRVFSSWVDGTIIARHGSLFQCLSPFVWSCFDLEQYNVVFSMTSYLASNMIRVKRPVHIQYIHSLPKNIYGLEPVFWLQKVLPYGPFISCFFSRAVLSTPYIISNTEHTRQVLHEKIGVWSKVIYPPVDIPRSPPIRKKAQYYICVTRIDNAKGLEIAVEACTRLTLPLKIVGKTNEPEYEHYLRSIAGPTVEFLGFLADEEIHKLYESAIAFIFTARNEDFGIAPVEAMAHGVPVVAYYGGGVKETVISHKTGVFFYQYNSQSLISALKKFNAQSFSPKMLRLHAEKFSIDRFKKEIYVNVLDALKKSAVRNITHS